MVMPSKKPTPAKSSRTTLRTQATLRSTSGAGFEFEDLISAWLQMKMLAGEPMPGIGGAGIQLQAQVSALDWLIDDLLVWTQDTSGARQCLAMSAKGNLQVSGTGLPADFVVRAWTQWRGALGPMNRTADGLALVTQGMHPAFDATWREIKSACSGADIELGIARIRRNPRQSRIFQSVQQPLASVTAASDDETIALIRQLPVLPVDLQLAQSEVKDQAIASARRLLTSGDSTEAESL